MLAVELVPAESRGRMCTAGVEMFKKQLNEGQAGDNVGLLLRSLKREDVVRGQARSQEKPFFKGESLYKLSSSTITRICFLSLFHGSV